MMNLRSTQLRVCSVLKQVAIISEKPNLIKWPKEDLAEIETKNKKKSKEQLKFEGIKINKHRNFEGRPKEPLLYSKDEAKESINIIPRDRLVL